MAELLDESGLPDGVFNIVNGGKETVEAICDHPGHTGGELLSARPRSQSSFTGEAHTP
jgi:acyl-CoA reductase-like NAD-dependent aldehyde dehydrogenase